MGLPRIQIRLNVKKLRKSTIDKFKGIEKYIDDLMRSYAKKMKTRAMKVHKYKNRTRNLTNSHSAQYRTRTNEIILSNSAYYAVWVEGYTRNKWMNNAIKYYSKDLKEDLADVPRRYKVK